MAVNTLTREQTAAAQRASVAVLTALRTGLDVPWSACLDDPGQWPAVVSMLASRLLAAIEAPAQDTAVYVRDWAAEAHQQT